MENIVLIIYMGIVIVMVITAITIGRRRSDSHLNLDTTKASDFIDVGSDNIHPDPDHSTSSNSSHGD